MEWELEYELKSELELKLQPERELESELEPRPLKLDKYDGHRPNPLGTFLELHAKNEKMFHPPGRPSYTIPTFIRGFSSKMHLQGTLESQSASPPPIFIDFLPTNSSRKKHYPCNTRGGRAVEVEVVAGGLGG